MGKSEEEGRFTEVHKYQKSQKKIGEMSPSKQIQRESPKRKKSPPGHAIKNELYYYGEPDPSKQTAKKKKTK